MARGTVNEGIFTALQTLDLAPWLGAHTADDRRIYNGWPQEAPDPGALEPPQEGGWLVFNTARTESTAQTIWEDYQTSFHILAPRFSVCDRVIDLLDTVWQWHVPQQHSVLYGDHYLIASRRGVTVQQFNTVYKLFEKEATYFMRFVVSPTEP